MYDDNGIRTVKMYDDNEWNQLKCMMIKNKTVKMYGDKEWKQLTCMMI